MISSTLLILALTGCGYENHPEQVDLSELIDEALAITRLSDAKVKNNEVKIYYTNLHNLLGNREEQIAYMEKVRNMLPKIPPDLYNVVQAVSNEYYGRDEVIGADSDIVDLLEGSSYLETLQENSPAGEEMYDFIIESAEAGLFYLASIGESRYYIRADYKNKEEQIKEADLQMRKLGANIRNYYVEQWADEHIMGVQVVDISESTTFDADYDSGIWLVEISVEGKTRKGKDMEGTVGVEVSPLKYKKEEFEKMMDSEIFVPSKRSRTTGEFEKINTKFGQSFLSNTYRVF